MTASYVVAHITVSCHWGQGFTTNHRVRKMNARRHQGATHSRLCFISPASLPILWQTRRVVRLPEAELKNKRPRIIIFSGKGGVGKTTVAAATAVRCAENGLKTIAISIDIAHSLSDAFQLDVDLHDHNRGKPRRIQENLWIQEVDIQEELDRHWGEVSKYLAALLGSSGITEVMAAELAIIPGMEDVVSLLYINQYYRENTYDVIVIDCAPTGESLRFIGMPTTLEWYMKKVFKLERNLMKVARPIAKRLTDLPLPEDAYFASLQDLFLRLDGIDRVLLDREITSIRLVTNAERMVIRETQRAFMYFCLYGLVVDAVIVNRLFPESLQDAYFEDWLTTQQKSLEQIGCYFRSHPHLQSAHAQGRSARLCKDCRIWAGRSTARQTRRKCFMRRSSMRSSRTTATLSSRSSCRL